jgi:hypothetical protein
MKLNLMLLDDERQHFHDIAIVQGPGLFTSPRSLEILNKYGILSDWIRELNTMTGEIVYDPEETD